MAIRCCAFKTKTGLTLNLNTDNFSSVVQEARPTHRERKIIDLTYMFSRCGNSITNN